MEQITNHRRLQAFGVVSVFVLILTILGFLVREVRREGEIEASVKAMRIDLDRLIAWRDVWQARVLPLDEGQNREISAVTTAVRDLEKVFESMRDKLEITRLRVERIRPRKELDD